MTTPALVREHLRAAAASLRAEADELERLAEEMEPPAESEAVSPAVPPPDLWYAHHVERHCAAGLVPTRAHDADAAAAAGLDLPRAELRRLRRLYAPVAWHEPGRKKMPRPDSARFGAIYGQIRAVSCRR